VVGAVVPELEFEAVGVEEMGDGFHGFSTLTLIHGWLEVEGCDGVWSGKREAI
jgi:hypothetical protein